MSLAERAATATSATEPTRGWSRRRSRRMRATATVASTPSHVELTWANRRPGSPGFARWAAYVRYEIDRHGLAASAPAIEALVILANQLGVVPAEVRMLADHTQPEPARIRAFERVVQALVEPR
jgi:hypothetical protein